VAKEYEMAQIIQTSYFPPHKVLQVRFALFSNFTLRRNPERAQIAFTPLWKPEIKSTTSERRPL